MKALTASNILPGREQVLLPVDQLFDLPNRQDEGYLSYLKTMFEELDKNPMRWPILVIKKEHYWNRLPWRGTDEQYGVVTGSNRFLYAVDRGYTHIESIICTDRSDWFPLWERTFRKTK